MKVQIRRNTFETNSSSMHSISMIGGDKYAKDFKLNVVDGCVLARGGEYGWNGRDCRTPQDKLDYVVSMIYGGKGRELEGIDEFEWLGDMIRDYTGYPLKFIGDMEDYIYIDHQSLNTLDEYFSYDEEVFKDNMKELIFNDKYSIIISNDNCYF